MLVAGLACTQVWRFLRQILGGLQHVHSHGLTHRDLKPKNIFVDFGDNLKVRRREGATAR